LWAHFSSKFPKAFKVPTLLYADGEGLDSLSLVGEGLLERAHERGVAGYPRELAFPFTKKLCVLYDGQYGRSYSLDIIYKASIFIYNYT
jgi:hypothetical protein